MHLIGSRRNSLRETLLRPVIEPVRGWSAIRRLAWIRNGKSAFGSLNYRARQPAKEGAFMVGKRSITSHKLNLSLPNDSGSMQASVPCRKGGRS